MILRKTESRCPVKFRDLVTRPALHPPISYSSKRKVATWRCLTFPDVLQVILLIQEESGILMFTNVASQRFEVLTPPTEEWGIRG